MKITYAGIDSKLVSNVVKPAPLTCRVKYCDSLLAIVRSHATDKKSGRSDTRNRSEATLATHYPDC